MQVLLNQFNFRMKPKNFYASWHSISIFPSLYQTRTVHILDLHLAFWQTVFSNTKKNKERERQKRNHVKKPMVRNYWHFRNVCQDGFKVDSAKEKQSHWNTVEIKLSIRRKNIHATNWFNYCALLTINLRDLIKTIA